MKTKPLTDKDYDLLSEALDRFHGQGAMNLEEMDGFFAALICCPSFVMPSEYLSELWGGEMADEEAFGGEKELNEFLSLVMRHWNHVSKTLHAGDVYLPILLEDENGVARANDWAHGFMRGMDLRREDWGILLGDDDHAGALVPIFALANEHHPDPEMRPFDEPIDSEHREKLIVGSAAGVMAIFRYFSPHRRFEAEAASSGTTYRRSTPKIGRNNPCYCGSGKKYKHCCGKVTLH